MIINAFTFLIARTVAQNRGVTSAEASRLGLVGAVLRPPVLGIVAASAMATSEAPGLGSIVVTKGQKGRQGASHLNAPSKATAARLDAEAKKAEAIARAQEAARALAEAKESEIALAEAIRDEIAAAHKEVPHLAAELKEAETAIRKEAEAESAAKEAAKAAAKVKAAGR
jgi:hypothetical protein